MALRVFISYSSRDRPAALRLKEIAESDGHDVWMDLFDIQPAARLAVELEEGVSSADVLCILLSPSAVSSPWVRRELGHALAAERKGLRVMPVIVRAAPIPDELSDRVAIDATRGLDDSAVELRIRRALGGDVDEGVLLDAIRRSEYADRAEVEAAEEELPALRATLDRVIEQPIRSLTVSVDQDTWPDLDRHVIEITITIDIFVGALSILLAPYVEGHTWRPGSGIEERPAEDFFASTKPRVDARLTWAGRTLTPSKSVDGTDLGELPLQFSFELPGDEYRGDERGRTMALLERFELPSLRKLIDSGSHIDVWVHASGDEAAERVEPASTDLALRLEVPLRHDQAGIFGYTMWADHDRTAQVLLTAPTLQACRTALEREALLSLYRDVPLRTPLNSQERRARLAAAVEHGKPVDEVDRWAAFTLARGRADVPRLRGQVRAAAQYVHEALGVLGPVDVTTLDYPCAFRLLGALTELVNDLGRSGATNEALVSYSDSVVDLGRQLQQLHPDEPDYTRALARNLMQRARLFPETPKAVEDVHDAVAVFDALVREEPLPWRIDEAHRLREEARSLLSEWQADIALDELPPIPG
jgi:hypothetical protein